MTMSTAIASTLLAALTIALALLTRSFLRLVGENKRLLDGNQSLSKQYFKTLEEFNNADLIYTTYFKDAFKMSEKREELIEYFRGEMELVYKRSTIGGKGDKAELYTSQELLDAQTCGIIRHIVRPWMPEIDKLAGEYYKKYAAPNKSEKQ